MIQRYKDVLKTQSKIVICCVAFLIEFGIQYGFKMTPNAAKKECQEDLETCTEIL